MGILVFFGTCAMAGPASPEGRPSAGANKSSSKPVEGKPVVKMVESVKKLKLHIASYNIERGDQFEKIQTNLERSKADLILLQEVPLRHLKRLAKRFDMKYHFGPYLPDGDFGMGILARGKLDPIKLFSMEKERNYALAVQWTPDTRANHHKDQAILVICTHLKSLQRPVTTGLIQAMKPHTVQAKNILKQVKKYKLPTIVAGDFNTLAWTPEYRTMATQMQDVAVVAKAQNQPTIFVGGGGYRIDYFFVQGPWIVRDYEVSPKPGSDHRMIQTVLELPIKKPLPVAWTIETAPVAPRKTGP